MAKYTKTRAKRKHQPVENRADDFRSRRRYDVYDGRDLLGVFVLNERTGDALAWNSERRFIGRFAGFKAAGRGISLAATETGSKKASAAEARRRLLEPARFASGLPSAWGPRG
jgi:hypothetical protein